MPIHTTMDYVAICINTKLEPVRAGDVGDIAGRIVQGPANPIGVWPQTNFE